MLNDQINGILARIAVLQQEIYDRETELASLLGLGEPEPVEKSRRQSRTRKLSKEQKESSKSKLKALIADMFEDGGKITQLAVMASSRSNGIVANPHQVAMVLSHMARKGEIDVMEERNEMGEREYRRKIAL